jgi:hypothetical protein
VEMVGKSLLQYLSQLNILEHHIKKGQHKWNQTRANEVNY